MAPAVLAQCRGLTCKVPFLHRKDSASVPVPGNGPSAPAPHPGKTRKHHSELLSQQGPFGLPGRLLLLQKFKLTEREKNSGHLQPFLKACALPRFRPLRPKHGVQDAGLPGAA